jgi:hypothetical protein
VAELTERIAGRDRQLDRLDGWVRAAEGELSVRTGGQLPTDDGGARSVAGWLAEVRHDSAAAAGSRLRTAGLLRQLPLIAVAVLEGSSPRRRRTSSPGWSARSTPTRCSSAGEHAARRRVARPRGAAAVGDPPDREPRRAGPRRRAGARPRPALPADQPGGGRQPARPLPALARGQRGVPDRRRAARRRTSLSDQRSAGQRRADAFVGVCEQVLRFGELPDSGGHRPQLTYVLPAGWAAAQSQRDACTRADRGAPTTSRRRSRRASAGTSPGSRGACIRLGCATAAWSGPQTRARIEALLCDARISRLLLDSTGQAQSLQSLTGAVTAAQRRLLAARDLGCTARRCTVPAAFCDAHHLVRSADGGPTTIDDLVLLCRRDHVLWHKGRIGLRDLRVPWHQPPPTSSRRRPTESCAADGVPWLGCRA